MALILICDDSTFQRNIIRENLRKDGFETIEATNGEEALQIVAKNKPDIIILDLLMPKVDGLTALTELKSMGSKIPVVVVTSDIQDTTKKKCMDLGAVGFVNKPVKGKSLENLLNIIKCYM